MANSHRMPVVGTAEVGSRGRIYIPVKVRDLMHLSDGDHIAFREERGRVYIEKLV